MHSNEIEAYKSKLRLSRKQRDVLVGLLLGDAHLETQNGGRTYRLKIEYSSKNKEYCEHVYEIFKEWVSTPPREKSVKSGEHQSLNVTFSTVSHGAFRFYAQQFYRDGKKAVPVLIGRLLTSTGLAYWFMDDGSVKSKESKGVIFNTQGFSKPDVERLVGILRDRFDFEAWERKQRDGYQIYVSGHSYERFLVQVEGLIYASMRYKIPKARRT